jgi:RNA 2',3'-cyclic 3'-phosphodiesterase
VLRGVNDEVGKARTPSVGSILDRRARRVFFIADPMRLFFALWPSPQVRAQLADWGRTLHAACGGRMIRPENLHMTLGFLGDVGEARIAQVEQAASEVAPQACSLVLDEAGYWKHNRIAWAGASALPPELQTLVAELRSSLDRINIGFDSKEFVAHVTLLRNAHEPRAMPELPAIGWPLQGFVLVQSVALPAGNRYEIRKCWKR